MKRLRGRSPHRLHTASPSRRLVPPLWRNRDFILLWSGQVVSTIGTRITSIAFPLLVLAETHSPAQAGVVGFAQSLPYMLFYLPAGALVDRWDRKRVMLVADAGRAIALGVSPSHSRSGRFAAPHVIVVAFVEGTLFVFFSLSESAALPQIVAKEQLPTAVAQNQARIQGADLVGQPLGGALFGDQPAPALRRRRDVVRRCHSSRCCSSVAIPGGASAPPRGCVRRSSKGSTGCGVCRSCAPPCSLIAVSNFAFAAIYLSMIVREQNLGASPGVIGVMLAFFGAGRSLGSMFAPWSQRHVHPKFIDHRLFLDLGRAAPSCACIENPIALGDRLGDRELFGPIFNVTLATYRYALVPDRLLARVGSAALVVAWGAIPLGPLSAGVLLEHLGARETILLLAGLMVAVGIAATISRTIRTAQPQRSSQR